MNNRILFMIIGEEVLYLQKSEMDHREWFLSLGHKAEDFDEVIRGFIIDNKIIFFKGINFNYDNQVIKAATHFSPIIKERLKNPNLEVYCGIVIHSAGSKWEPVLKINDSELEEKKEEVVKKEAPPVYHSVSSSNKGPILEFHNHYDNPTFIKRAILSTIFVLGVYLFNFLILQKIGKEYYIVSRFESLSVFLFVILSIICIFSLKKKSDNSKYLMIAISVFLLLSFDFISLVLGIYYFLFSVDEKYIIEIKKYLKILIDKIKNIKQKKSS